MDSAFVTKIAFSNGKDFIDIVISIIPILIASIALLYSARSYLLNKISMRAYLAPHSDPGQITRSNEDIILHIILKNYGNNPLEKLQTRILYYNESTIQKELLDKKAIHDKTANNYILNPVPKDSDINVVINYKMMGQFFNSDSLKKGTYVCLCSKYYDVKLNKWFCAEFVWKINEDLRLFEVDESKIDFINKNILPIVKFRENYTKDIFY